MSLRGAAEKGLRDGAVAKACPGIEKVKTDRFYQSIKKAAS